MRLGGRIETVWGVGRGLTKRRIIRAKIAVNLVCADMDEAKTVGLACHVPLRAGGLQQDRCAHDIRSCRKGGWSIN